MKVTIQFGDLDGKNLLGDPIECNRILAEPRGITIHFAKGVDDRSRRPIVYTVDLTPATHEGTWEHPDDSGLIEHVRPSLPALEGSSQCYDGIWVEGGQRKMMVLTLTKA